MVTALTIAAILMTVGQTPEAPIQASRLASQGAPMNYGVEPRRVSTQEHWTLGGSPMIAQAPGGYGDWVAGIEALRKRDPNYDPTKDHGDCKGWQCLIPEPRDVVIILLLAIAIWFGIPDRPRGQR